MHWISSSLKPFVDSKESNTNVTAPSNNPAIVQINGYRQGIELSKQKVQFQNTVQPKIWSGHRDQTGSIDNQLKGKPIGLPLSHTPDGNSRFDDRRREFNTIDYLVLGNSFPMPVTFNNGIENLFERGIIEPLTIEDRLPTNESTKTLSHTIRAVFSHAIPHRWFGKIRGTTLIEKFYNPQETTQSPFFDFAGHSLFLGISGSVLVGGTFDLTQATIEPFNDTKTITALSRSFGNHITESTMSNIVKNFEFENPFIVSGKIQAGSGIPYVYGRQANFAKADSIAFYDRMGQKNIGHSRIRGVMPHTKIQNRLNASGRMPINQKATIDHRTSPIAFTPFDDKQTLVFNNQTATVTNFPLRLVETAPEAINILSSSNSEYNTNLHVPNIKQRAGISDAFSEKKALGQVGYKLYNDERNRISTFLTQQGTEAVFFKTGSVIPGFKQELAGKTIIEIEMPQKNNVSFGFKSGSGEDYPMSYYDFGEKTMFGVGSSLRLDQYTTNPLDYFAAKALGFGPMHSSFIEAEMPSAGLAIDNFGFPWHHKYNVPTTSSMLYSLTASIAEPFLLEKIMLEFSGSATGLNYPFPAFSTIGLATFFILHQSNAGRSNSTLIKKYSPETSYYELTSSHRSGSLALVTAMQIGHKHSTDSRLQREYMLPYSHASSWDTNGIVVISGSVKMPTKSDGISDFTVFVTGSSVNIVAKNSNGGRTGIFEPWTRNFREVVSTAQPAGFVSNFGGITFNNEPWKNNPYLLLPQDKLIFGWQAPFGGVLTTGGWTNSAGPTLNIAKGVYRLYLIGSYLKDVGREYKENHKVPGQELSSITIHEVIE